LLAIFRIVGGCGAFLAVLGFAALVSAAGACPVGNLLRAEGVRSSRGVADPAALSDGVLSSEGDPPGVAAATAMTGLRPYVEWDLGTETSIVAAAVQADDNDTYRIAGSLDGKTYTPIFVVETAKGSGLRERAVNGLHATARFVRFEAVTGDSTYAASEVRVYCLDPVPWPPSRIVRDQEAEDAGNVLGWQMQSVKLVLGLLAFPLLFSLASRLGERRRRLLYGAFMLLAALAWTQFGRFNGGDMLHSWDSFHYFMGTKYFPEAGYTHLYRCGAVAERESGHGAEVDNSLVRDVETNELHPGDWTRADEGDCHARFTPERWTRFKADLGAFRDLFGSVHVISDAFSDHGFNATPIDVAWLRLWTHDARASRTRLTWLAQLDSLALIGTVAALTWGFGPLAGVVAALVLSLGGMWSYHWVGGCLGRHTWLFCAALGVACLERERTFPAAVWLTLSGLLRLFPFVFVGAVGLHLLVGAVRERRLNDVARRFFAGVAVTFALGAGIAGIAVGFDAYPRFAHVFERHSHSALTNQLGLTTALTWTAGEQSQDLANPQLTNPFERWEAHQLRHRTERRPVWAFAVGVSLAVLVLSAVRGVTLPETVALSGLLVFSALPMTSYDYTWLVLLVAFARGTPRMLPAVLAFALFTLGLFVFGGEAMETQHVIASLACGALLAYGVPWRELWAMVLARVSGSPGTMS
jgi:hypothetical protein